MSRNSEIVRTSKFLSLVLRHRPELLGIELTPDGWTEIDTLLERARGHGRQIDRELLVQVVAENDKQRFAISDDGKRIRANQGHSVAVELNLQPQAPPARLFHGTVEKFLNSIRAAGLRPGNRQHVHLSADYETAVKVGSRRGPPVVLEIRAGELHRTGHVFFLSANGVWLTSHVPPDYLQFDSSPPGA